MPPDDLDSALAAFGLYLDGDAAGARKRFFLWPEHLPALNAWLALQTQWRVGMAGPTGLDYAGVLAWMQARNLRPRKRRTLLEQIQTMERAALAEWAERAARQQRSSRPTGR